MAKDEVREQGLAVLDALEPTFPEARKWRTWLKKYEFKKGYPDDKYVWLTCALALEALNQGNFGVGSILVDPKGRVVVAGHNEVFYPYFRSDQHAEMVVLSRFEEANKNTALSKGYVLYTSDEPCPMCFTRLIVTGVSRVYYAAADETGGMVRKVKNMPIDWVDLAGRQTYAPARCSPELAKISSDIFLYNVEELNEKLRNR